MIKRYILYGLVGVVLVAFLLRNPIQRHVEAYAIQTTQEWFGDQPLAREHEQKILAIAQEMDVAEPLIIRRMNTTALQIFSYCNAFIFFPPLTSQAFFYASEGFFEDLSPEEQRFLIGHELIHAREHHFQYCWLLIFAILLLCVFSWLITSWSLRIFEKHGKREFAYVLGAALVVISVGGTMLATLAYKRRIEREADAVSLELLQSHEGGLKVIDRWLKEYKQPFHHAYGGWLSDHPSNYERTMYFLNGKSKQKDS